MPLIILARPPLTGSRRLAGLNQSPAPGAWDETGENELASRPAGVPHLVGYRVLVCPSASLPSPIAAVKREARAGRPVGVSFALPRLCSIYGDSVCIYDLAGDWFNIKGVERISK